MDGRPESDAVLRRKVEQNYKHSKIVDRARKLARIVEHSDIDSATLATRTEVEKSLPDWLMFFMPDAFADEWSDGHKVVLSKIQTAIERGGLFALAMPRGHGKSTICKGAATYALLTGKRKYIIAVAATAELSKDMLDFIKRQLGENEKLAKFYPEACAYITAIDGKAIKAKYQLRRDGKPTGMVWAKDQITMPTSMSSDGRAGYRHDGGVVEAHGLTGAIRGKSKHRLGGRILRPDFVILDDPQTRESAESPSQCDQRERIILGDVLGLAGPRNKIAAAMPCTIVKRGDLADRFLDRNTRPEWQGDIFRLIEKWPDAQDTLWKEYAQIYRDSKADGLHTEPATEFYIRNRDAMDAGSSVSWPARVRDGELSALQTAENMMIEMGPQFWAEMQNDPQSADTSMFELTIESVLNHATDIPRFMIPDAAHTLVGHCDINRSGLHWCLAGFDQAMTCHVTTYGRWPNTGELWEKNATEQARKHAIFRGLTELSVALSDAVITRAGTRAQIGLLLIDRGYEPDVVHRFCASARLPFKVFPARGYAAHKYFVRRHSLIGSPMQDCHVTRSDFGQFLAFNADAWREAAQRALLAIPGESGGATIHAAPPAMPRYHLRFAEHLCGEQLTNKYQTDGGMRWEWTVRVGYPHDWLDAYSGCWVAAAASGLTTSGLPKVAPVQKRRRASVRMVNV